TCMCFYFFFFQAEDGIRDFHVTGVQTCALPIYKAYTNGQYDPDKSLYELFMQYNSEIIWANPNQSWGAVNGEGVDRRATPRSERSEEHTSELQSRENLVCRLLLEKKKPTEQSHG